MGLREKLDILKKYDEQDPHETFMTIADDYAIEFAEWLENEWTCDERWSKITETKQLLQIFKKEKGL